MNIYISHSANFEFKTELYLPLKRSSLASKHTLIIPQDETRSSYPIKQLLEEKTCDLIIAEVSFPATGQGIELGWAHIYKIPIICIYKENFNISNSLKKVSDIFLPYQKIDSHLFAKLEQNINNYE